VNPGVLISSRSLIENFEVIGDPPTLNPGDRNDAEGECGGVCNCVGFAQGMRGLDTGRDTGVVVGLGLGERVGVAVKVSKLPLSLGGTIGSGFILDLGDNPRCSPYLTRPGLPGWVSFGKVSIGRRLGTVTLLRGECTGECTGVDTLYWRGLSVPLIVYNRGLLGCD